MFNKNNTGFSQKLAQTIAFLTIVFLLVSPAAPAFADEQQPDQSLAPNNDSSSISTDSATTPASVSPDTAPTTDAVDSASAISKGPDTAFSSEAALSKYTPEQRAEASKFDLSSSLSPSGASNKWLNSYEYTNHLPDATNISGAYTYDIPIATPPGRNGIQPNLKISYNNQNDDTQTIFGKGWSLNLPYIERENKDGVTKMYGEYNFLSSLDGEFSTSSVSTTTGKYYPRFDDGSMHKYIYSTSTNTWTMYDKNGTQYTFGSSTTSRIYDPSNTSHIARWMLEKIQDTNGNSMSYAYTVINSQVYPVSIIYTGQNGTGGAFEVDFQRGASTRSIQPISYKYGFQLKTSYNISEIDIKFNGSLVNKYVLSYTTGFNTYIDLLQSVTQTGYDESNNQTTLPALSFTYQQQTTTWATTTPQNPLPPVVDSFGNDLGFRFFFWSANQPTNAIHMAPFYRSGYETLGYTWLDWGSGANNIPTLVDDSNHDIGSALVDVDGNGMADVVQGKTGAYHDVYLWSTVGGTNGSYVSASTSMTNLPDLIDGSGNDTGTRFGDFNGDGYSDYLVSTSSGAMLFINKGNGTGWANGVSVTGIVPFVDSSFNDTGARVMDFNGDGIDDIVKYDSADTQATTLLNAGDGTSWIDMSSAWHTGVPQITQSGGAYYGTNIMDIDGDGLLDFVVSTASRGTHFFINTGNGWTERSISSLPFFLNASSQDTGTRVMSSDDPITGFNDDLPDFVMSNASTSVNFISQGHPVDQLVGVTLPTGGTLTISYQGVRVEGAALNVVKTVVTDPGLGEASTTDTYGWADAFYTGNYQDRKFTGFGRVFHYADNGETITSYHQGNGNNNTYGVFYPSPWDSYAAGEYNDIEAKMYHPFRVEEYSGDRLNLVLQKLTINKVDSKDLGNGRTLVFNGDTVTYSYDGLSTHKDSAVVYDYSTSTGNLITKTEYGEVNGANDGTFTDVTNTDNRITTYTYASSTATSTNQYLSGLLADQTQTDYSGTKVNETKTYYDNLALGSATAGNPTKQEFWKTGSSYASTTKTYNSFGLVTQMKDARGATTTLSYDSNNLYVSTSTNALGQITGYLYDYTSGSVKRKVDPNGLVYQTTFDGLDRPLQESEPDLTTPSTLVTKDTYTYTDTALGVAVLKTNYLNSATSSTEYSYKDGLNRVIQTRGLAQGNNTYVVKDIIFNTQGLLQQESLPYFASSTARSATTSTAALYTSYLYDYLQRPTKVTTVVGSTTSVYSNWKVTTTDANGNPKDTIKDAFGNLAAVVEHLATTTATTTYQWDGNNNLTLLTDANANVRNFTYDGLSRELTAQDLHATGDASFGTWNYTYDDANNLTQTIDPKSQTVNYTYDALNRVLTEDYTGRSGTEVTYAYDACLNGIGNLCAATTTDATTNFTYNANGGTASERETIATTTFTTSYGYDRQGNITDITYPDTSIVKYGYDNTGFLNTISRKGVNASTFVNAISQLNYAPTGAISLKRFGNGIVSTFTYDANQLYRLTNILSVASSTFFGIGGGGPLGGNGSLGMLLDNNSKYASGPSVASPIAQAKKGILAANINLDSITDGMSVDVTSGVGTDTAIANAPQVFIDGTSHTFANTDDNSGEDLIISTDQSTYTGISQAEVYFSVENKSTSSQNIDLNYYFADGTRGVTNIQKLNVSQKTVPQFAKNCTQESVASTTKAKLVSSCNYTPSGTYTTTLMADSQVNSLAMVANDENRLTQEVSLSSKTRKNLNGYVSARAAQDVLQPGEKAYYKGTIQFKPGTSGKFYIEAVGNNGAYGQLDPWYSSSWQYRKKITIQGVSGTGSNYQVLLKIGESSTSTGSQFNLGNHSSSFPSAKGVGGDLRFTRSDGATELPYWVEDVTGSTSARVAYVWVKVADDLSTNQDIYVYYGNAAAGNVSNGTNTFNFFDDFNDGVIDPQKWTTICSSGCNITDGVSSSVTESGDSIKQFDSAVPDSQGQVVATSTNFDSSGYAVKRRFRTTDIGTFGNSDTGFGTNLTNHSGTGTTSPRIYNNNNQNTVYIDSTGTSTRIIYGPPDISVNTWYREEAERVSSTSASGIIWTDGFGILGSGSTTMPATTDMEHPYLRSGDGHDAETDWIIVRKYHANEPTFSTTTSEETMSSTSTTQFVQNIQNIFYTYDKVGNITQINDLSDSGTGKVVNFTYDTLNRLLTASTTGAASSPYSQTYSYNAIGDLLNKSDVGAYSYAGTGNANPHAATTIAGLTYTYDNNGNLIGAGPKAFSWSYRNLLATTTTGSATSTYGYDFKSARVKQTINGVTTFYPNRYSSLTGTSTTDNIYLGDTLIAAVDSGSSTVSGGGTGSVSTSTPAIVQSKKDSSGTGSVTFTSAVTSGNLVVVGLTTWGQFIPSNTVTDNKGNTYTKAGEVFNTTSGDHAAIFYAKNVSGGSSFTVSTGITDITIAVHEYSGITAFAPLDKIASSTATSGTKLTSGNVTTSLGNELYFGVGWSGQDGDAWTAGSGYTLRQNETNNATAERIATEDAVITNASTTAARFSVPTSEAWLSIIATFKPATTTSGGMGTSTTSSSTTRYILPDHLGSTNVVTDAVGNIGQIMDYYPYGASRISTSYAGYGDKHQFIGQYTDDSTNLDYLNARYYNSTNGQFLSEDPIFLGNPGKQNLMVPQSLNSYSYAENSPVVIKDPSGLDGYLEYLIGIYSIVSYYALLQEAAIKRDSTPNKQFTSSDSSELLVKEALSFTPDTVAFVGLIKNENTKALTQIGLDAATNAAPYISLPNSSSNSQIYQTTPSVIQTAAVPVVQAASNQNYIQSSPSSINATPQAINQQAAINSVVSAFTPTNPAQAAALQNLLNAFKVN